MVQIGQVLNKLFGGNSNKESPHPGLTPNEVELKSFERRKELDEVKRKLAKFRQEESMLRNINWDKKLGFHQRPILSKENIFKQKKRKKEPNILNTKNVF